MPPPPPPIQLPLTGIEAASFSAASDEVVPNVARIPEGYLGFVDQVRDNISHLTSDLPNWNASCLRLILALEDENGAAGMAAYMNAVAMAAALPEPPDPPINVRVIAQIPVDRLMAIGRILWDNPGLAPNPDEATQSEAWNDLSRDLAIIQSGAGQAGWLTFVGPESVPLTSEGSGLPVVHPMTGQHVPLGSPELLSAVYQFVKAPAAFPGANPVHEASALPVMVAFRKGLDANYADENLSIDVKAYAPTQEAGPVADWFGFEFSQLPEATAPFAPHLAEAVEGWEKLASAINGQSRTGTTGLMFLPPMGGPADLPNKRFPAYQELRYLGFFPLLHSGSPGSGRQHSSRGLLWLGHWLSEAQSDGGDVLADVRTVAAEICQYMPWLMGEALPALVLDFHEAFTPEPDVDQPGAAKFELELTTFELDSVALDPDGPSDIALQSSLSLQSAPVKFTFPAATVAIDLSGAGTQLSFAVRKRSTLVGWRIRLEVEAGNFTGGNRTFEVSEQFGPEEPAVPGWRVDWSGEAERAVTVDLIAGSGLPASDPLFVNEDMIPLPVTGFLRSITLELVELPEAARPSVAPAAPANNLWRPQISQGIRGYWARPLAAGGIKLFLLNSTPFERTVRIAFDADSPPITALVEEVAGVPLDPEEKILATIVDGAGPIVLQPYELKVFAVESPLVFGRPVNYWWESVTDFAEGIEPAPRHFHWAAQDAQNLFGITFGDGLEGAAAIFAAQRFSRALRASHPSAGVAWLIPLKTMLRIAWKGYFNTTTNLANDSWTEPASEDAVWTELNLFLEAALQESNIAAIILYDEPNTGDGQRMMLHHQRALWGEISCHSGTDGGAERPPATPTGTFVQDMRLGTVDMLTSVRNKVESKMLELKRVPIILHLNLWWPNHVFGGTGSSPASHPAWLEESVIAQPAGRLKMKLNDEIVDLIFCKGGSAEQASVIGDVPELEGVNPGDYFSLADFFAANSFPFIIEKGQVSPEYPASFSVLDSNPFLSDPGWVAEQLAWVHRELNAGIPKKQWKPVLLFAQAWGNNDGPPFLEEIPLNMRSPQKGALASQGGVFIQRFLNQHEIRHQGWTSFVISRQGMGWFARIFCPWLLQRNEYAAVAREIHNLRRLLNGVVRSGDVDLQIVSFPSPVSGWQRLNHSRAWSEFLQVPNPRVPEFWLFALNPSFLQQQIRIDLSGLDAGHLWEETAFILDTQTTGRLNLEPGKPQHRWYSLEQYGILLVRFTPISD